MKFFILRSSFFVLLCGTMAQAAPRGAWGPGGCGPGGCDVVWTSTSAVKPSSTYNWAAVAGAPDEVHLSLNGREIGAYFFSSGEYFPWDGKWMPAVKPPIPPPAVPFATFEAQDGILFGLDESKRSSQERFTIDGQAATAEQVKTEIMAASLEDDSRKKHLTGIASDAAGKKRFEDFFNTPTMAPISNSCRCQAYDLTRSADRAMCDVFQVGMDPKFAKAGGVLVLQDAMGADGRGKGQIICYADATPAAMEGALRKADPSWNTPPAPSPSPSAPAGGVPAAVWIGLGVGALVLAKKHDKVTR